MMVCDIDAYLLKQKQPMVQFFCFMKRQAVIAEAK